MEHASLRREPAAAGSGGCAAEQGEDYKQQQAKLIASAITRADVVITTAQLPGRKAPRLVTAMHVAPMRPHSSTSAIPA